MRKIAYIIGGSVAIVLFGALAGFVSAQHGYDFYNQAQALQKSADTLYDHAKSEQEQSRAMFCDAYGKITAACFANTPSVACNQRDSMQKQYSDSFSADPIKDCVTVSASSSSNNPLFFGDEQRNKASK